MTDKFCKDCKGFHPGITKFDAPWCDRVPSVYDFVTGTSKSAFCCNARLSFWFAARKAGSGQRGKRH